MGDDKRRRDKHALEFHIGGKGGKGGKEIGYFCANFEWACFINAGYRITASFIDMHQNTLDKKTIDKLLEQGRDLSKPLEVRFIMWHDNARKEGKKSEERTAYVIKLDNNISGSLTHSVLEIVAIDPASWYLNRGICDGAAHQGNVQQVIEKIVKKYAPPIKPDIGKTLDNKKNWWWEMRLDPKTLITSLTEWASSITESETPMVIQSEDKTFTCKEWNKLEPPGKLKDKKFAVTHKIGFAKEIDSNAEVQILSNNSMTPVATRLYTASISATTGLYIDKTNTALDPEQRYVNDKFTPGKLKPNVKINQSYKKPEDEKEESTLIEPIPEHNNGDMGIKYQDYSIGRARDWFIKTIYSVLRIKITITPGDPDFDSVKGCGCAKIQLQAIANDGVPYYIDGNWLLYGFRHLFSIREWKTELMLSRIDYNATGKYI